MKSHEQPRATEPTVGVIDACGGNLTSLTEALWRLQCPFIVSSKPAELKTATHLILPGVGAAEETMDRLKKAGLVPFLRQWRRPLLGICIGMQVLFETSEEGMQPSNTGEEKPVPLLGLIPGRVVRLKTTPTARVPHMGWNQVTRVASKGPEHSLLAPKDPDDALLNDLFYFVHSYRAPDGPWVTATTDHGGEVPAAVQWRHYYGVQFHPEKSQGAGLALLRNFINL